MLEGPRLPMDKIAIKRDQAKQWLVSKGWELFFVGIPSEILYKEPNGINKHLRKIDWAIERQMQLDVERGREGLT